MNRTLPVFIIAFVAQIIIAAADTYSVGTTQENTFNETTQVVSNQRFIFEVPAQDELAIIRKIKLKISTSYDQLNASLVPQIHVPVGIVGGSSVYYGEWTPIVGDVSTLREQKIGEKNTLAWEAVIDQVGPTTRPFEVSVWFAVVPDVEIIGVTDEADQPIRLKGVEGFKPAIELVFEPLAEDFVAEEATDDDQEPSIESISWTHEEFKVSATANRKGFFWETSTDFINWHALVLHGTEDLEFFEFTPPASGIRVFRIRKQGDGLRIGKVGISDVVIFDDTRHELQFNIGGNWRKVGSGFSPVTIPGPIPKSTEFRLIDL